MAYCLVNRFNTTDTLTSDGGVGEVKESWYRTQGGTQDADDRAAGLILAVIHVEVNVPYPNIIVVILKKAQTKCTN